MPALLGTLPESPPPPQADKAAVIAMAAILECCRRRFGSMRCANVCLRRGWVANHEPHRRTVRHGSGIESEPL